MPGVYIKWFLKAVKPEGLHKMLHGFEDKTGYAQCIFAYKDESMSEDEVKLFRGTCDGNIVFPRGATNFGWDPIFEPLDQEDSDKPETFAEMSSERKNSISHRSKALMELKPYLGLSYIQLTELSELSEF